MLVPGECEGLGSTICGILWPKAKNEAFYFWLGDSKIYLYHSTELVQLSIDDKEEVVLSKDITPGQSVISRNYITNSLGRSDFQIRIERTPFLPGDQFILATDGFVESTSSFSKRIINAINHLDLEKPLQDIFTINVPNQTDDSTVVIVRRNIALTDSELQKYLKGELTFEEEPPTLKELEMAFLGLKSGIESENGELCKSIIDQIKSRQLKLSKEQLKELLVEVVKRNFNPYGLYQELVLLLRKR